MFFNFVQAFGNFYATTFTSASGMDLGFNNPKFRALLFLKFFCYFYSFFRSRGNFSTGYRHTKFC